MRYYAFWPLWDIMRFPYEISCFWVVMRFPYDFCFVLLDNFLMRFHLFVEDFVLICVSPKSPPWNASMSGVQVGGEEVIQTHEWKWAREKGGGDGMMRRGVMLFGRYEISFEISFFYAFKLGGDWCKCGYVGNRRVCVEVVWFVSPAYMTLSWYVCLRMTSRDLKMLLWFKEGHSGVWVGGVMYVIWRKYAFFGLSQ